MSELESNLPEIHTEILNDDKLQLLLGEIQSHGSEVAIQVKGGGFELAEAQVMAVQDVGKALLQKKAVQIRYVRDKVLWSDTYSVTEQGVQLVRFKLPAGL